MLGMPIYRNYFKPISDYFYRLYRVSNTINTDSTIVNVLFKIVSAITFALSFIVTGAYFCGPILLDLLITGIADCCNFITPNENQAGL